MTTHDEAGILIFDHNRCCYGKRLSVKASVHSFARAVDPRGIGNHFLWEIFCLAADRFQWLFYIDVFYHLGWLQLDPYEVATDVSENAEPIFKDLIHISCIGAVWGSIRGRHDDDLVSCFKRIIYLEQVFCIHSLYNNGGADLYPDIWDPLFK